VEEKKAADNCAPTLFDSMEEESKAEVIHVAEIGNKQDESTPHPIYSVVRFRPHDL